MKGYSSDFIFLLRKQAIGAWLLEKSKDEIIQFANQLLNGYQPCPRCYELCEHVYNIPQEILDVKRNLQCYQLLRIDRQSCKNCLSIIKADYNEYKIGIEKVKRGHIEIYIDTYLKRKIGYTYIFQKSKGIYKIGNSVNPRARMRTLNYLPEEFICAIRSEHPHQLEKHLHNLYDKYRLPCAGELFELPEKCIEYIKSIKSINNRKVCCYNDLSF